MIPQDKFLKLIIDIDQDLSESGMSIHARPFEAFYRMLNDVSPGSKISPSDFGGPENPRQELNKMINSWYEMQYGDRVKYHLGPGNYVIEIAGEAWEVVYPACFGKINFTIDADLVKRERFTSIEGGRNIPEVNILWHVKGLTNNIASSLSLDEKNRVCHDYMFGLNAVQSLRDLKDEPLMKLAKNDYDTAIDNLFRKHPDYNNSKWASLQFAEKTMKSKLVQLDVEFERNHNLVKLAKKLAENKVFVDLKLIERIQCNAGVRYGEDSVSEEEAILAVKSALAVFQRVFNIKSFSM